MNNGQRERPRAIWRRLPAMRKDEFNRLAIMLDNERGAVDHLCYYRNEIVARKSAMACEITDLNEQITRLKSAITRRETLFLKQVRGWKRRAKAARRKALKDVCDVLNYKPK